MAKGVEDRDLGYAKIIAQLQAMEKQDDRGVFVGVHGKEGSEQVIIAATNEFGTTQAGASGNVVIPERSFLRSTVAERQGQIGDLLIQAVEDAVEGKRTLDQGLGRLGEQTAGWVVEKIKILQEPDNAESTKAAKRRKSGGKEGKPLVDEGRLFQSISWEIRK